MKRRKLIIEAMELLKGVKEEVDGFVGSEAMRVIREFGKKMQDDYEKMGEVNEEKLKEEEEKVKEKLMKLEYGEMAIKVLEVQKSVGKIKCVDLDEYE